MPAKIDKTVLSIIQKREETERIIRTTFSEIGSVFINVTLPTPQFRPPELGFIRMISWLYIHYYEAGAGSIPFLIERFNLYKIDADKTMLTHFELVNKLRTYFQHNLDLDQNRDVCLASECELWFEKHCATRVPGEPKHWAQCLNGLCLDSHHFFEGILRCIRAIEVDDARALVVKQWIEFRARKHAPHEFDGIIETVAKDMGRDSLETVAFRKRHFDSWNCALRLLRWPYDFAVESRKLVEQSILDITIRVLPITGEDIINDLGITPGPRVGTLLEKARSLYSAQPCSKLELLAKLRLEIGA